MSSIFEEFSGHQQGLSPLTPPVVPRSTSFWLFCRGPKILESPKKKKTTAGSHWCRFFWGMEECLCGRSCSSTFMCSERKGGMTSRIRFFLVKNDSVAQR